jgi:glycosyltransferase involved in cell wall biosynthesis
VAGTSNNGTLISAQRFARELVARGHEVRALCAGDPGTNGYDAATGITWFHVPEYRIPAVSWLAHRQGTAIARPCDATIAEALRGASVLHVYEAWPMEARAARIARELGVPALAAFHIQPQNITYNLGLGWCGPAAGLAYALMRKLFYQRFEHIHCPSQMIATELRRHGYRAQLHVISNGVPEYFVPGGAKGAGSRESDVFHILNVGRFAPEKCQSTIIKAVARSRHAERIQLHFAGQGPLERRMRRLGSGLPLSPKFGYCEQGELVRLMHSCSLYVHSSAVDIEGLSCLEAIATGLVPVINASPQSASGQFALCDESLYANGSADDLAHKIDYWIEHPAELASMRARYAAEAQRYSLKASVTQMEQVYEQLASAH